MSPAATRTTECPIEGCEKRHPRTLLMCRGHWYSISKITRDAVWHAVRHHGVFSDEYEAAREAAIDEASR